MSAPLYAWNLTQERLDALAHALYQCETISNIAAPGNESAENIACLITDLRAQCCMAGGADDPFPEMSLFGSFAAETEESAHC